MSEQDDLVKLAKELKAAYHKRKEVFDKPAPEFARRLADLWAALEKGATDSPMQVVSDEVFRKMLEVTEANRRKFAEIGPSLLMERLFQSFPDPIVIFLDDGKILWNASLASFMDTPYKLAREQVPGLLAPLHEIARNVESFSVPILLYPLNNSVFSIRFFFLPESDITLAYFSSTGLIIGEQPFVEKVIVLLRVSGIPAKQIAFILQRRKTFVDYVSKKRASLINEVQRKLAQPHDQRSETAATKQSPPT